jgi:hypothetical protein
MDKSIDDDSDSDHEDGQYTNAPGYSRSAEQAMTELSMQDAAPPKPPRPMSIPMPPVPSAGKQRVQEREPEEDDDDDPFGDSNGKISRQRADVRFTDLCSYQHAVS